MRGDNNMTYDEFMALSEDEQRASYIESAALDDITAERDSYKNENEELVKQNKALKEENRKTKELNYTLTRKISVEPKKSAEEIINDMFK